MSGVELFLLGLNIGAIAGLVFGVALRNRATRQWQHLMAEQLRDQSDPTPPNGR